MRSTKALILKTWYLSNCIETPVIKRHFKSVFVGESIKKRIEVSKRKIHNLNCQKEAKA